MSRNYLASTNTVEFLRAERGEQKETSHRTPPHLQVHLNELKTILRPLAMGCSGEYGPNEQRVDKVLPRSMFWENYFHLETRMISMAI